MSLPVVDTEKLISSVTSDSWREELENTSRKYHITAAWIAIIFDPIFAATDYINIPEHWIQLLCIRLSVALITFVNLQVGLRRNFPSYVIAFVPVMLISAQNAYTFYLIDNEGILGHSLNYMALLIGASMFVLWSLPYSLFVVLISAAITAVFVGLNKDIALEFFLVQGGFLLAIVGIFMVVLIKARYDLTLKEIKARLALKASNQALAEQKYLVESKNKKIVSSINYAKRIQDSVLGDKESIKSWFSDAMVLFKPKDVLSGDFYWFYQNREQDIRIIIAADCTGHGVPAALMTIMGSSLLNEIVIQNKIFAPHKILHTLDDRIIQALNSDNSRQSINDGMDVTVLTFHQNKLFFSGAKNPMLLIRQQEVSLIKGAKYPIGSTQYSEKVFKSQSFDLLRGDRIYTYSDGYQDQFGHNDKGKYLNTRFRKQLQETATLPMAKQEQSLLEEFEQWRGDNKQTDDLLVVGIEI